MIATIVVRTINTIPCQSIQKRATCNIFKYVSGGGNNNSNIRIIINNYFQKEQKEYLYNCLYVGINQ